MRNFFWECGATLTDSCISHLTSAVRSDIRSPGRPGAPPRLIVLSDDTIGSTVTQVLLFVGHPVMVEEHEEGLRASATFSESLSIAPFTCLSMSGRRPLSGAQAPFVPSGAQVCAVWMNMAGCEELDLAVQEPVCTRPSDTAPSQILSFFFWRCSSVVPHSVLARVDAH